MLRLIDVSRLVPGAPGGGLRRLHGVTLDVLPGEFVVVEGGRGAGKSTLLRIAATLDAADQGRVLIGGRDVTRLQGASLPFVRRNIGYLPSADGLLARETALGNVLVPLAVRGDPPAAARGRARAALSRLGVEDTAGRPIELLSQAERRLVALARALVATPPLLVLDDPSAALAPADVGGVLDALHAALERGAAVIAATADAAFASAAVRAGARRVRIEAGLVRGGARLAVVGGSASGPMTIGPAETRSEEPTRPMQSGERAAAADGGATVVPLRRDRPDPRDAR